MRQWIAPIALALLAVPAFAQDAYPSRPITMVIAFPPGGVTDVTARPTALAMERALKQRVIVENKPGAAGATGNAYVANSRPDGYTVLMALSSISVIPEAERLQGNKPPYELAQFAPIALISADPVILVVRDEAPWKNVREFVADARNRPARITYSSSGIYGALHMPFTLLEHATGTTLWHVPYNGGGPALQALLGSQVDVTVGGPAIMIGQIKAKRLRPLASFGDKRLASLPDVPTLKELGIDAEYYIWAGLMTPAATPPATPEEIAEGAIGAAQAGAAIVHLHAREPADGRPTQDPKMFMRFLPKIKAASNVVINLTTGGAPTMSIEERLQPALQLKPEVASLNMGSMNFGLYEMLGRYKDWKYDWEKPYLAGSDERIFKNSFKDIDYILQSCSGNDTRFEIECYDIGHLYTAAHFLDRKLVKPPLLIQSVFGIRGGIGPHPEDVMHMKRTADRLFGDQYLWSVLGAGRNQMFVAAMSAVMGGNVRVGLEDSLWLGRGTLAKTNAEQVAKIRRILEELGLQIATPDEAREMLKLKGGRNVAF